MLCLINAVVPSMWCVNMWKNPIFNNMDEGLKIVRNTDKENDYEQLKYILKWDAFGGYDPALLEQLK